MSKFHDSNCLFFHNGDVCLRKLLTSDTDVLLKASFCSLQNLRPNASRLLSLFVLESDPLLWESVCVVPP